MHLSEAIVRLGSQWIVAVRAYTGSTVDAGPARITPARLRLLGIPVAVCVLSLDDTLVNDFTRAFEEIADARRCAKLRSRLACSMAAASLRACEPAACIALVSIIALALASLAVADACIGALSVVVRIIISMCEVIPSKRERALAEGAISTHPRRVAGAALVRTADAMARAEVGAVCLRKGKAHCGDGGKEQDAGHRWSLVCFVLFCFVFFFFFFTTGFGHKRVRR